MTVLLAVHNGEQHLDEQIQSILAQDSVQLRIVASLDPGSDRSESLLRKWGASDPRIEILPVGEAFGAAAPNFFRLLRDTDLATTEYVAFADQDDIWFPSKLARAISLLREHGVAGYSSNVLAWYPDGRRRLIDKSGPQRRWDHLFSSPGPGCTHVMRGDLARDLQRLVAATPTLIADIEYHDWLDYAYAREHDLGWVIDPEPTMLYRQHAANQLGANIGIGAARRRLTDLRSRWLWDQATHVARAIGASDALPIRLVRSPRLRDRIHLIALSPQLRRRRSEALALAAASSITRRRLTPRAR